MSELVVIREMQEKDILALDTQFVQQGWPSRQEILMNYLEEQLVKQRTVFVAEKKATLLGYVTLLPLAKEGPFKNLYPEIADFNVFLPFQKQGVGRLLLNRAENVAKSYADTVSFGSRPASWLWCSAKIIYQTRICARWFRSLVSK